MVIRGYVQQLPRGRRLIQKPIRSNVSAVLENWQRPAREESVKVGWCLACVPAVGAGGPLLLSAGCLGTACGVCGLTERTGGYVGPPRASGRTADVRLFGIGRLL